MIDLKQAALKEWQEKNFPRTRYEEMTKDQLIDMIMSMQFALGMAEEVGEVCHHLLKGIQGIRGGVDGFNKKEIADGVADSLVFGQQLLSSFELDAETEISEVINKVLQRNWKVDPEGNDIENHNTFTEDDCKCPRCNHGYLIQNITGLVKCNRCNFIIRFDK